MGKRHEEYSSYEGRKFHSLTVNKVYFCVNTCHTYCFCDCDCGNKDLNILLSAVIRGNNKSCRCLKNDRRLENISKHRIKYFKIWDLSAAELKNLTDKARTFSEVLRVLGVPVKSSTIRSLRGRVYKEAIDVSHFIYKYWNISNVKKDLNSLLVEGIDLKSYCSLKRNLLENKLIEDKCLECGLLPVWQSKKLTLQLDHINGNRFDNRLNNLRLLCPNCHTQTPTYCNKNRTFMKTNPP